MGTTSTVTIGSDTFTVYGSLAGLTSFANGRYSPAATKWRNLAADDQKRTFVSAVLALDARMWQGTKTAPSQPLDWPRTDVVDENDESVDPTTIPDRMVSATYELTLMIAVAPDVQTAANNGSNVKQVKAGPVDVEFFRPTDGLASEPLPDRIMLLVGVFLSGTDSAATSKVSGASCASQFVDCATDTRSQPF